MAMKYHGMRLGKVASFHSARMELFLLKKMASSHVCFGFPYDDYGKLQGQIGKLDFITPSGRIS